MCLAVVLSAVQPNLMTRDARGVVGAYASPALKVLSSGTPVGPSGLGQVVRSAYATQPLSYQQDQPSRGVVYQPLQGAYAQQQLQQLESPLKNYRGGDVIQQAVELQVPETIVGKDVAEGGALPPAYAQAVYEESPYAQISGGGGDGSGGAGPSPYTQVAGLSPYSQVGGGGPSLYSRSPASPYAQGGVSSPFSQAGGQVLLSSSPFGQPGPYSSELGEGPSPYAQSGVEAAPQGGGGSSRGPPLEFRGVYPGLSGPPHGGGLSGPFGFGPSGVSHSPRPSPYLFNQPVHTLGQSNRGVTKGVPSKTTKSTQSSASVEGGDVPIIMYGGGGPGGPDGRYNIEELEAGGPSPQGVRGPPVYNLQGLGGGPEEFSPYSGGPVSYSLGGGPGGPPPQHFAYSPESGPQSSPFGGGGPPRGPTFLQEVSSPSAAEYVAKPRRQRHPSFDFSPMQLLRRPRHGYLQGGPRGPPPPPSHDFDY